MVAEPWKGLTFGLVAGAVGTLAMNRFTSLLAALAPQGGKDDGGASERAGALDEIALLGPFHREEESAPETLGRVAYRRVRGREPGEETRERLANGVHWAQGVAMGALYGLAASSRWGPLGDGRRNGGTGWDPLAGLAFGSGLWLVADELAVPLLGLSKGPTAHPPRAHLEGLCAHLVYGMATAAAVRALERLVERAA